MIDLDTLDILFTHSVPGRALAIGPLKVIPDTQDRYLSFLRKYGKMDDRESISAELSKCSIMPSGLNLSQLMSYLPIEFISFDIYPGPNTEIVDLNQDTLPKRHRNSFDLILNCGTSEHILNQMNVFKVIHEAARIGAMIYHQVPTTGHINNGYLCYHPRLFRELPHVNGYEILDIHYRRRLILDPLSGKQVPDSMVMSSSGVELRGPSGEEKKIPNYDLCVLLRTSGKDQFRFPLEIDTRHAEPDVQAVAYYRQVEEAHKKPT
ncbi:MAG: hypothetical protein FJX44_00140 [Alphaproteobacteria bacterium]|nr:hypothetical protein [Alphaproteobacteria bacterium]